MDNIKVCRCKACLHGGKIDIDKEDYVTPYRNRYFHRDCYELETSQETIDQRKKKHTKHTSEWNKQNYKTYTLNLRQNSEEDQRIIEYLDDQKAAGRNFAQVFRDMFHFFISHN